MQNDTRQEITWHKLIHANRMIPVPFQLTLAEQDYPVYCDEVVRIIPGKRLVAFGTWDDKPIVAKLFFEPANAKRHAIRELLGIEALVTAHIPTPKLLYRGTVQKKRVQVLIFEKILNARTLDEIWQEKTSPQELALLMYAVTIELATQHVLGIVQRDLHLKNLLLPFS